MEIKEEITEFIKKNLQLEVEIEAAEIIEGERNKKNRYMIKPRE